MMTLHHSSRPEVVKVSLLDSSQMAPATCLHYVNDHRTRDLRCSRGFQDECTLLCEQGVEAAGKTAAMVLSHDRILVDNPWRCYHNSHPVYTLEIDREQCCPPAHHNLGRDESSVDVLNDMISHLAQVTGFGRPGTAAQAAEKVVYNEKAMEMVLYVVEVEEMVLYVVEGEVNVLYVVEEEVTQLLMVRSK
jgi:hypothetical protein